MALQSSDLETPFECKDSENYGSPPSLCMLTTLSEISLGFSQRESTGGAFSFRKQLRTYTIIY